MLDAKPMDRLTADEKRMWIRHALAAYYADKTQHGWPDAAPDAKGRQMCGVIRRGGLYYVVLLDREAELLACYRIRRKGARMSLKWVKREPSWTAAVATKLAA